MSENPGREGLPQRFFRAVPAGYFSSSRLTATPNLFQQKRFSDICCSAEALSFFNPVRFGKSACYDRFLSGV